MNHEEQPIAANQLRQARALASTIYRATGELDFDLMERGLEEAERQGESGVEQMEFKASVSALRRFKETIEEVQ